MGREIQAENATDTVIVWKAQPGPQTALCSCPCDEILFGGARGGGKTDGSLGEWAQHAGRYGDHAVGVFMRKTLVQLEEAIERAKQIYIPVGALYREQKKTFIMPGGARLKFRQIEKDSDAEKYQGHSYTRVYLEELTNWASSYVVDKMRSTLRSVHGVPCKMISTANPGGPGHQWVKALYIDPAPLGYQPIVDVMEIPAIDQITGERYIQTIKTTRVYIPSRVQDNRKLMENDPTYILRLSKSGSESLVRAWLEGDWDVIEGAFFDEWRPARHVVRPVEVPKYLERFVSFDWGSAKPFSCGLWAVADGTWKHPDLPFFFPRGSLIRINEWYGAKVDQSGQMVPNVGIKAKSTEVGKGIVDRFGDNLTVIADPAVFTEDGGPSHAERLFDGSGKKLSILRADNKRIPGWDEVRTRLQGNDDGIPLLYFFSTCIAAIRTLPALQHDDKNPEDVDTEAEDHAPDEIRYACMARPLVKSEPAPDNGRKFIQDVSLDELWDSISATGRSRSRI